MTFPIIAPLIRPTKQGIELGRNGGRLVLEGRRVVVRCRDVRVGDIRSDEIRRHLEQGGDGWFRVDEQMSGPVAVVTLTSRNAVDCAEDSAY